MSGLINAILSLLIILIIFGTVGIFIFLNYDVRIEYSP